MNQLTLTECSRRRLDSTYVVVYAIKNEINIKKGDYIEKSDIYTLIGIDIKGFRQFINIYQDRVNNNRFWLDCFEGLKSRGLQNIFFFSRWQQKHKKDCKNSISRYCVCRFINKCNTKVLQIYTRKISTKNSQQIYISIQQIIYFRISQFS